MTYQFHFRNAFASEGITLAIQKILKERNAVVLCIGSDIVSGDALGPLTGTILKKCFTGNILTIGSLSEQITAKEAKLLPKFCNVIFPNHKIISIDAAVGEQDEVGLIRVSDKALVPGSGIQKNNPPIGTVSIQGIVAEREFISLQTLKEIRMKMVFSMAKIIAEGVGNFLQMNVIKEQKIIL